MQVSHLKVRRVYTMKTSQHARREMESEVCGGKKVSENADNNEEKGWMLLRRRRVRRLGCR